MPTNTAQARVAPRPTTPARVVKVPVRPPEAQPIRAQPPRTPDIEDSATSRRNLGTAPRAAQMPPAFDPSLEGAPSLGARTTPEVSTTQSGPRPVSVEQPAAASPTNGHTAVAMNQGAYRHVRIGNSNSTIARTGCMLTSFAMASTMMTGERDLNPSIANDRVRAGRGFQGGLLMMEPAARALGMRITGRIGTHNSNAAAMRTTLDRQLAAGRPAVLGVDYRAGSGGSGNGTGVDHWVTVTGRNANGTYTAIDPNGGRPFELRVGAGGLLQGAGANNYTVREMILLDTATRRSGR
jgi:hypothetical protein